MLEGAILKASMVLCGKDAADRADVQTVAEQTVKCLKENVPAELAGVVFLSGGQSELEATAHLDAMNKIGGTPWPLTFSLQPRHPEPRTQAVGREEAGRS